MSTTIINPEIAKHVFLNACRARVGRPYIWGGQSIEYGFDCSGFVIDCLHEAGVKINDCGAAQLYTVFADCTIPEPTAPGQLVFYGNPINHVMVVLDIWGAEMGTLIGARGGDSAVTRPATAYHRGAFVDVVALNYWREARYATVDIWR